MVAPKVDKATQNTERGFEHERIPHNHGVIDPEQSL